MQEQEINDNIYLGDNMLKSKYATLSKEEKIKAKEEFYQTEFGKNLKIRLDRLFLIGIAGLLFSIVMFATNTNIWEIILGIMLLIASLIFIFGSMKIRRDKISIYLNKKKK